MAKRIEHRAKGKGCVILRQSKRRCVQGEAISNRHTGAEPDDEFVARILGVFSDISNRGYAAIAVVTHGGVIKTISRELLKRETSHIADCGYMVISKDNDSFTIDEIDGIGF